MTLNGERFGMLQMDRRETVHEREMDMIIHAVDVAIVVVVCG